MNLPRLPLLRCYRLFRTLSLLLGLGGGGALAQQTPQLHPELRPANQVLALWQDNPQAKAAVATGDTDIKGVPPVGTLLAFLPDAERATGAAVLVLPGGGYGGHAYGPEGRMIAAMLNQRGITAFVLRYQLPGGDASLPGRDVRKAIRMVRAEASNWKIDPNKIGVWGFSAGGHLAALMGLTGNRPEFQH